MLRFRKSIFEEYSPGEKLAKDMKRFIIIIVAMYFSIGLVFALSAYSIELHIFECVDQGAPNGYITILTQRFENRFPSKCSRRGFKPAYLSQIPVLTVVGPVLLSGRYLNALILLFNRDAPSRVYPIVN